MATKDSGLLKKMYEIQERLEKIDNSSAESQQKEKVSYILFFAIISLINPRRSCTKPLDEKKQKGFEHYKISIPGPLYELLIRFLSETTNYNLTNTQFTRVANDVAKLFFANPVEYIQTYSSTLYGGKTKYNYDGMLLGVIDLLNQRKLDEKIIKIALPTKEVQTACIDLKNRIKRYNGIHNEKTKKHNKNVKLRENKLKTNIVFSVEEEDFDKIINVLNKAEGSIAIKQLLLPIYSISPYYSLCIAHKSQLPNFLVPSTNGQFVFVIAALVYDVHQIAIDAKDLTLEHFISHIVISSKTKKAFKNWPADINNPDEYYKDAEKPCSGCFEKMRQNYIEWCDKVKNYPMRKSKNDLWLPIPVQNKDQLLINEQLDKINRKISPYTINIVSSEFIGDSSNAVKRYENSFEETQKQKNSIW